MDKDRFSANGPVVTDNLTGLMWTRDAALTEFPLTWQEALAYAFEMNRTGFAGYRDWHLPNRRELFSLISHCRVNPAVPENSVFENIFNGYYWTSTSCARLPEQAWYVHLGGAKVYRGMKHASYMVWPVRTAATPVNILKTGQQDCYDQAGQKISCKESGQDGQLSIGRPWPDLRFIESGQTVYDKLTGLTWTRSAAGHDHFLNWYDAIEAVKKMNREKAHGYNNWRMPDIRELESLVDLGSHSPAIEEKHPFSNVEMFYWSSTTSMYETRYAWALYLQDGAAGVGFKANSGFHLWPVRR
ncbi:MAG: DUF1566 domain-containing protein [Desulfobacterales bacterium]|nr:DUF1566 domain-containing protein [Desulfobacterales bacterium]